MFLPGHSIASLAILDLGRFDVGPGRRTILIPAYLLTTDRGKRILIDGGFPPAYAADPEAAAGADGLPAFGRLVGYRREHTLPGALGLLGLAPGDIGLAILTHGHIDHAGALPLIRCPLVLTAAERADPRPCYFGSARPLAWPDVPMHTIAADTEVCAGLTLIPTPGHTPGHLSALVTLRETGPVLLAADAINRETEPAEGFPDAEDPGEAARSAARLLALRDRLGAQLVYGHDPAQARTLRLSPGTYR
jgi:N-acyl homoserine lactone hydrolase